MDPAQMSFGLLLSFLERRDEIASIELDFLRALKALADESGSFRAFRRPSGYVSAVIDLSTLLQAVHDWSDRSEERPIFALLKKGFFGTSADGVEVAPYSLWEAIFREIERHAP